MPLFECPRDGEQFTSRPPGGRCPTHKVLVEPIETPPKTNAVRLDRQRKTAKRPRARVARSK